MVTPHKLFLCGVGWPKRKPYPAQHPRLAVLLIGQYFPIWQCSKIPFYKNETVNC